jgi:hypothetical protein
MTQETELTQCCNAVGLLTAPHGRLRLTQGPFEQGAPSHFDIVPEHSQGDTEEFEPHALSPPAKRPRHGSSPATVMPGDAPRSGSPVYSHPEDMDAGPSQGPRVMRSTVLRSSLALIPTVDR